MIELDPIDRKILDELTADARIPIAELARRVSLSKTPVAARIRHLEEIGLITGYRAVLSPREGGVSARSIPKGDNQSSGRKEPAN